MPSPLRQRVLAEGFGTAALVMVIVGSGAAAERLSSGDVGLMLFENALATAAGLFVLITVLSPVSGAHLNPVITLLDALRNRQSRPQLAPYVLAQCLGAVVGALLANAMFDLSLFGPSAHDRGGVNLLLSEVIATAGLVVVVMGLIRSNRTMYIAACVGAYIGAAYFFTASTSFANPAVTIGRAFTDSFSGIAPSSVVPFIAAQLVGAAVGLLIVGVVWGGRRTALAEDAEVTA
jgi:arsenate reductase